MKDKKPLKEKYIIAKRKSTELMNQIRNEFRYNGIDIAFAMEEELSWYLIRIIDEIDNGIILKYKNLEHLKKIASYYLKFFRGFKRREFVPTSNHYKDKDCLFFVPDNQHYNRLKNIIQEMPKKRIVLLATNIETQKILRKKNLDFISFGDYLVKPKKTFRIDIDKIKWSYKGVDLKKRLKKLIKYLEINGERIAYYIDSLERIYRDMKIKKIVTIDSVIPINRTAILVAKKMKIKSWIIKPEIISKESGRYYLPVLADNICVYGNHDRDFLIKSGFDKKRIFTVGMDLNFKKKIDKLPFKKKVIVFLSHFYDDLYSFEKKEKDMIMEKLKMIAETMKDYEVVIKLHPREKRNMYGKHHKITIVKNSISAETLINNAEVVIISTSTSSLKVIAMRKKLLVLNYINLYMPIDYEKYDIKILKSQDDIIKAIDSIDMKKEKRKELLQHYCGKISTSNLAAKRIRELLFKKK
jgi:hypothetical protein